MLQSDITMIAHCQSYAYPLFPIQNNTIDTDIVKDSHRLPPQNNLP